MRWRRLGFVAGAIAVGAFAGIARGADPQAAKTVRIRPQAVFRTDKVMMLAANGPRAAVLTSRRRACGQIAVWTAPGRRVSRFGLGELGCNGDGVDELALGGGQVGWIESGGGNDLELTVMNGRLPHGRTKRVAYEVNGDRAGENPAGGWVGHLVGGGRLLAWNRWQVVCDRPAGEECYDGDPQARLTGEQLVRIGAGVPTTSAGGPDVYALAAAGGNRFAVVRSDGVATLDAAGASLALVPTSVADIRGVGLSATTLFVERSTTLELYDPASGVARRSIALGGAAPLTLAGATKRFVLLTGKRRLVLVRLGDGARAELSVPVSPLVGARLTENGLFYAYDVATSRQPGRVAFVSSRSLAAAF